VGPDRPAALCRHAWPVCGWCVLNDRSFQAHGLLPSLDGSLQTNGQLGYGGRNSARPRLLSPLVADTEVWGVSRMLNRLLIIGQNQYHGSITTSQIQGPNSKLMLRRWSCRTTFPLLKWPKNSRSMTVPGQLGEAVSGRNSGTRIDVKALRQGAVSGA